jgi:hypothetical protein
MKIKLNSRSIVASAKSVEAAGVGTALKRGAGAVADLARRGASKVGRVAKEGAGKVGKVAQEGAGRVSKIAREGVDTVKKRLTKPTIKPDPPKLPKGRKGGLKAKGGKSAGRKLLVKQDLVDLKAFAKLKGTAAVNFMATKLGPLADTRAKKLLWLAAGIAAIEVIPASVKATKRAKEVKQNGGKPPSPYVNSSAYIADAFPTVFWSRMIGTSMVEMFEKSKQFNEIKGTIGKEQSESLVERLRKRAEKAPADSQSAAEGINRLKLGYAAVEKAGMTVPSQVEDKIKEGFAKTMEKQQPSA